VEYKISTTSAKSNVLFTVMVITVKEQHSYSVGSAEGMYLNIDARTRRKVFRGDDIFVNIPTINKYHRCSYSDI
jgi:hypothetical protein